MMGYLDSTEYTSRAIDPHGWLHTGDLGKLGDDGFLYVTGRIKGEMRVTQCAYLSI